MMHHTSYLGGAWATSGPQDLALSPCRCPPRSLAPPPSPLPPPPHPAADADADADAAAAAAAARELQLSARLEAAEEGMGHGRRRVCLVDLYPDYSVLAVVRGADLLCHTCGGTFYRPKGVG